MVQHFAYFKICLSMLAMLYFHVSSAQMAYLVICNGGPGANCNIEAPCSPVQNATFCPNDTYCFLVAFPVGTPGLTYTITIGQSGGGPNLVYVETTTSSLYIRLPLPTLPSGSVTTFTLLSMTDSAGGVYDVSQSQPVEVTILPGPTNLVISQNGQACFNNTVGLTASNGGGATSYTWSNGVVGATNFIFSPGQYTVTATLGNGCSATATANVNYELPQMLGIFVNGPVCTGQPVSVNAVPATGATFLWSNGATGQSTVFTPPAIFSVTATTPSGCTGTASINYLSPPPSPTVSIVGANTICPGQTVNLSASGSFDTYNWSTGSQSPAISVSSAGAYSLTVTNSFGCTGSATQTILSAPLPAVSFSGPPEVCAGGCQNFSVIFTGTAPFNLTYGSPSGITQTQTFTSNTGAIQVCPPVGTPPGSLTLAALSLTDANCTCEP